MASASGIELSGPPACLRCHITISMGSFSSAGQTSVADLPASLRGSTAFARVYFAGVFPLASCFNELWLIADLESDSSLVNSISNFASASLSFSGAGKAIFFLFASASTTLEDMPPALILSLKQAAIGSVAKSASLSISGPLAASFATPPALESLTEPTVLFFSG